MPLYRIAFPLLMLAGAAIAAAPAKPHDISADEARLAKLLAGRTAGPAASCLPTASPQRSSQVGETAIVFDGPGRTLYVNRPAGGCPGAGRGYSLVGRHPQGRLCAGDIMAVRDLRAGFDYGSCTLGDFVPYRRTKK